MYLTYHQLNSFSNVESNFHHFLEVVALDPHAGQEPGQDPRVETEVALHHVETEVTLHRVEIEVLSVMIAPQLAIVQAAHGADVPLPVLPQETDHVPQNK